MLKHVIKIIWKKNKLTKLFLSEYLGSYFICFLLFLFALSYFKNTRLPLGFNYNDVYFLNVTSPYMEKEDMSAIHRSVKELMHSTNNVNEITTVEGNVPIMLRFWKRYLVYNGENFDNINIFFSDDEFAEVMDLNIIEGRWFNRSDDVSNTRPIVINQKLKQQMFGNKMAIGQEVDAEYNGMCKVVGVIDDYRYRGKKSRAMPCCFFRTLRGDTVMMHNNNDVAMTSNLQSLSGITLLIKSTGSLAISDQQKLVSKLKNKHPGINFLLKPLSELQKTNRAFFLVPVITICLICGFLVVNLLVGLFGVLWYNINLRKHEIGLRLALGATKEMVYFHFISEMWVQALFGMLPAIIIAMQFMFLKFLDLPSSLYIQAIVYAILLMLFLVLVSTFWPSRQASKIEPAVALREE